MPEPTCLDLFCGAGGAAVGYRRAGFGRIVGVDIKPQPRYPFEFVQADALTYLADHGAEFDFIHASPECQRWSVLTPEHAKGRHIDYITPVQALLDALGKPYVIENVSGARHMLRTPVLLCGSMFGLRVFRHRYFEVSPWPGLSLCCNHNFTPILVSGTSKRKGIKHKDATIAEKRQAMDIPWMSMSEIDQAIPPAYTEYLGRKILTAITR